MTRIVEAKIKISDLEEFKTLLSAVAEVLHVYEEMDLQHLVDDQLSRAIEQLLAAREALRSI